MFAALVVLAGCGGGGGGGSVAPSTSSSSSGSGSGSNAGGTVQTVKVSMTIVIPKSTGTTSSARKPAYIDSNTQSMTLTLLQANGVAVTGAAVQGPFNLTTSSPNCTSGANGLSCTYSIEAPVGGDIFVADTYSAPNAGGSQLGSGSVALHVLSNGQTVASLTLQGPVASVELYSDSTNLWNAVGGGPLDIGSVNTKPLSLAPTTRATSAVRKTQQAGNAFPSSRLYVVALDANGNQIINPTTYDIPLTMSLALNGFTPDVVQLEDVYAFPGTGPASSITTADGGTITVTSPGDTITLSLTNTAYGAGFPVAIGLSYTPQAGPNAGNQQTVTPIDYAINAPQPQGALSVAETTTVALSDGNFAVSQPGSISLTVNNSAQAAAATTGTVTLTDPLPAGTTGVGTGPGWSCNNGATVTCTTSASIPIGGSAPPVTIALTFGQDGNMTNAPTASAAAATFTPASYNWLVYGTFSATAQPPYASNEPGGGGSLQLELPENGVLLVSEPYYEGTFTASIVGAGCGAFASLPNLTGPGSAYSFSVAPIAVSGASACAIHVHDGNGLAPADTPFSVTSLTITGSGQ